MQSSITDWIVRCRTVAALRHLQPSFKVAVTPGRDSSPPRQGLAQSGPVIRWLPEVQRIYEATLEERTHSQSGPRNSWPVPKQPPTTLKCFHHSSPPAAIRTGSLAAYLDHRAGTRNPITMAEQLLDQARDLFDGQIVRVPEPTLCLDAAADRD